MILSRHRTVALVACGVIAATSCSGGDTTGGSRRDTPVSVIATTSIWADITSNVLCGDPVPTLIPAGADPHTFEPSLGDRELLDNASAVIANGADLEESLTDLLATVQQSGTDVVEMTDQVDVADGDPHIWQDPTLVASTLDSIAAAAATAGRDGTAIAACADDYRAELTALDAEITALFDPIPAENRVMVTSHDALGYFAERYGLDIVGTVIPSTNTLAATSAADLAALADVIADRDVPAVFTEQLESANDAEALAERLGVGIVPLVTDALTADPAGDTYIEMMRSNATKIAEALAP